MSENQETMTVEIPEDVRTSLAGDSGYEVPAKIEGVPKGTTKADIEKKIRARIDAFRTKSNISGEDLMQVDPEVRDRLTVVGGMRSKEEMIGGDMVGMGAAIYGRDQGIDYYTDVQNFGLRKDLSRDDTPEEKEKRLDERVGAGNWGKDSRGEYYLTEEGTKAVGTEYNGYPVAIDAHRFTRNDVSDLIGDAPAIIGSMLTTKGAGALWNIGRAGFFAMVGKAGEETYESLTGQNLQPMSEVGGEIVEEGFLASTGEGGVRIASKFGKKFFAPESARMTPERKAAMDTSLEMGLKPDSSQVTDAPLVGRFEGMKKQIFGDKKAAENSARIRQEINSLEDEMGAENAIRSTGKSVVLKVQRRTEAFTELYTRHMRETRQLVRKQVDDFSVKLGNKNEDVGTAVIDDIKSSYSDFNIRVVDAYSIIDRTRGIKLYPMAKIKAEARDQLSRILRTAKEDAVKGRKHNIVQPDGSIKEVSVKGKPASGGQPVLANSGYVKRLERIISADDMIDLTGAQELRTFLSNAAYTPDLLKGVESRHARLLRDAVDRGFLDVENGAVPEVAVLMRNARKLYSEGMDLYSDVFVKKMVRNLGATGAVEPSLVVDTVIKHPASVRGMKKVLEQTDEGKALWQSVKREHFDTILDGAIDLEGFVKPKEFERAIKGGGAKTEALKELYGSDYRELHKFSRELVAIDGKISAKELTDSGVKAALKKAQQTKAEMDSFTSQDWVKELGKTGKEFVTAVDHVFKPKSPERVLAAKNFYGEGSETWSRIKRVAMKDILSDIVKKDSNDIFVDVLNGGALKQSLNKYGRDTIEEMFGEQHATQLYNFADAVEFIARKPKQASGTLVATNIAIRPWKNLGTLARVWGLSSVMSTERGLQYLTEGFLRPQNTLGKIARPAAENILRLQIQMQMLVNDDNGDLFEYFMGENAPTPEEMKQDIRNQ